MVSAATFVAIAFGLVASLQAQDSAAKLPPLVRLAPPYTANKISILAKLRHRDFAALDAEFDGYQKSFENNPATELNEKLAFDSFATDDPSVGDLIGGWIKAKPSSFAAHMALGSYLSWRGWRSRGDSQSVDSGLSHSSSMGNFFRRSSDEIRTALKIRPKVSIGYATLVGEARAEQDPERQRAVEHDALAQVPASFAVREEAMECRYPRWGGNHQMMDDFAQQSQAYVKQNPLLHWLLGFVDRDEGETLAIDGDLDQSIKALTRAINKGGDYSGFYFSRGESYLHRERYLQALADFDRANELSPQDPELIMRRAATFARLERPQDALDDLKFVAIFEAPDDFSTQLHDWAVAALKDPR